MLTTHFSRIEIQVLRNLVEMNFQRVTRLWRAVPTLRPARRFVREDAHALKLVARQFVGHGLQSTGVEGARYTVTSVCSAIKERFEVHRRDRAVFLHSGLHVHQSRMATTMAIENFFARQSALHRTAGDHCQLANDDFMIERIALAAKAAAVRRGDHANVTGWNAKNFRQSAMNV